jgi:hypothetical protein
MSASLPVATTGTDIPVRQFRASATDRIRRHGGLTPRLIVLCGRDLAAMYPMCR